MHRTTVATQHQTQTRRQHRRSVPNSRPLKSHARAPVLSLFAPRSRPAITTTAVVLPQLKSCTDTGGGDRPRTARCVAIAARSVSGFRLASTNYMLSGCSEAEGGIKTFDSPLDINNTTRWAIGGCTATPVAGWACSELQLHLLAGGSGERVSGCAISFEGGRQYISGAATATYCLHAHAPGERLGKTRGLSGFIGGLVGVAIHNR